MTVQEAHARTRIAAVCRRQAFELGPKSELGRGCADWARRLDALVTKNAPKGWRAVPRDGAKVIQLPVPDAVLGKVEA